MPGNVAVKIFVFVSFGNHLDWFCELSLFLSRACFFVCVFLFGIGESVFVLSFLCMGRRRIKLCSYVSSTKFYVNVICGCDITWPRGFKFISCSTQLSTKFQLLIKTKIPTNIKVSCFWSLICCIYHVNGILTFMSRTNYVLS